MSKSLINLNVPKAGRIKTKDLAYVGVSVFLLAAAWGWSSRLPGIGQHVAKGKSMILRVAGLA